MSDAAVARSLTPTLRNSRELVIEWGDCDAAGIVFYPRYFQMFDTSTGLLLQRATGMRKSAMLRHYAMVGIPMVDTRAKFHRPSTFGDPVRIDSRITAVHRSSFEVEHRLLHEGDVLAVEGFETRVWVGRHPDDPARIKAQPIPEEVIARFAEAG
ncbi:acyl-CoA thioesterase [Roseomonas sp. BN140053]|uniref:acyl-CoA thioesterase n=1 Tax=Roseomonas sp. BN140053 TaxID=3391898 RepID=UPI0039EAA140